MTLDKKNSLWLSLQYFIGMIFSLVNLKLNLIHFEEKVFGIWILFTAVWGIGNVLDFGLGTAITRYVAIASKDNDVHEINKITSTGFLLIIVMGIILFIAGNLLAPLFFYNNFNFISVLKLKTIQLVFLFLGISFLFRYLSIFLKSILEGFSNFILTSKLSIANSCFILISVIIVLKERLPLTYLAFAYMIVSLIILVIYYFILKFKYPSLKFKFSYLDIAKAKSMFGFSLNVQFASILGTLIEPLVKYLIGNYASLSLITYYEIARKFAAALSGLFSTAFKIYLPKSSILKGKLEYKRFLLNEGANLSRLGIAYSGIFYGIFSILFIYIIKTFFNYEDSIIIFLIISLSESVNITNYPIYISLMGFGKAFYLVITQGLQIIFVTIGLILGFMFFKNYLGFIGFYLASLIVFLMLIYFARKESGISVKKYLKLVKFHKLFIMHLLIVLLISAILNLDLNLYFLCSIFSFMSLLLFLTEVKTYGYIFVNKILRLTSKHI